MKWLVVLIIIFFVFALIALRYRRQIQMGLQVWRMFRQVRKMNKPAEKKIDNPKNSKDVALVRCERCGKWIPQTEAMKLRSKNIYCSTACMERAAKLQSMVD